MRALTLFLIIIIGIGCGVHKNENVEVSKKVPDFNVALKFINDYIKLCEPNPLVDSTTLWIEHNKLLTNHFKIAYKKLLDSARKADPELGLDFDPIFDAQDFDDSGCVVLNADTNTGYLMVEGKQWKERFTVALKVVNQDNKWLVDGSGIINIPNDKRAPRE